MAELKRFLERFRSGSDAETVWLQELFVFVRDHVCLDSASSVSELSLELVRILKENSASRTLPVSYSDFPASVDSPGRPISIERGPGEAEQIPGLRPLPPREPAADWTTAQGRGPDLILKDKTGELSCRVQESLDRTRTRARSREAGGRSCEGRGQSGRGQSERGHSGRGSERRLSVTGLVSAVCPLLDISGTTFFIFSLSQKQTSVNVIVKDSSLRLWWSRSVHVGLSVHVTHLRACSYAAGVGGAS
ncbi:hypothetical protein WMY93_033815 [Mugilogobius chulae]|uniref:Uncharacterized protein n=1 Tax=Mugilogobius chulae TaxID=88201 RepID=A0AAW0MGB6_9GOBI